MPCSAEAAVKRILNLLCSLWDPQNTSPARVMSEDELKPPHLRHMSCYMKGYANDRYGIQCMRFPDSSDYKHLPSICMSLKNPQNKILSIAACMLSFTKPNAKIILKRLMRYSEALRFPLVWV